MAKLIGKTISIQSEDGTIYGQVSIIDLEPSIDDIDDIEAALEQAASVFEFQVTAYLPGFNHAPLDEFPAGPFMN